MVSEDDKLSRGWEYDGAQREIDTLKAPLAERDRLMRELVDSISALDAVWSPENVHRRNDAHRAAEAALREVVKDGAGVAQ